MKRAPKNETFCLRHFDSRSSFFAPKPRGNAYCAGYSRDVWLFFHYHYVSVGDSSDNQGQEKVPTERNTSYSLIVPGRLELGFTFARWRRREEWAENVFSYLLHSRPRDSGFARSERRDNGSTI